MKVLLTGALGQLGRDLAALAEPLDLEIRGFGRTDLDVTNRDHIREAISDFAPNLVINCAAWTAVDACESDPERAEQVNGYAVGFIGEAAARVGAHLVHVSTDYVFDGLKSSPYLEDDETNPQSVYGKSKLLGEQEARAHDATVVRTSWVCSGHGGNMVETILRLARKHEQLSFVDDQRGHPTFTADLAPALLALGRDRVGEIVHVTNAGAVSWFEFAQEVLAAAGESRSRVSPIATVDLLPARPAPRPENSVLSNAHYLSLGYEPLRDFRLALAEAVPAYV